MKTVFYARRKFHQYTLNSVLAIAAMLFVSCSGGGSTQESVVTSELTLSDSSNGIIRSECESGSGEIAVVLEETFSLADGTCGFSPLWEETRGNITSGIDSCSLEYFIPAGSPDEPTPAQVQLNTAGLQNLTGRSRQQYLRVSWTDYFEPGYEFPNSSQKLARFYDSDGGQSLVNAQISENNSFVQILMIVVDEAESMPLNYFVNFSRAWDGVNETGVPLGVPIQFEMEALLPSRSSPGYVRLRFADVDLYVETDHQVEQLFGSSNCLLGFSGVWVGGNWSNIGPSASKSSLRYIDNIRILHQK